MKRLITILITLILAVTLAGQSSNKSRYVYNFAGGITVGGTYATNDFNEKIDSIRIIGGTAYIYSGGDTIPVYTPVAGTIDNATIFPELVDTIPLVTFGAGSGLIADTALFNNNVLIGSFYNEGSDTLVITQLMGILKEGTGTETIAVQISWHTTFLSGSAINLNSSALTVNSLTTGTEDVSFANSKIPPNVFVWGILSGASKDNKPTFLSVTLSGYKIPGF